MEGFGERDRKRDSGVWDGVVEAMRNLRDNKSPHSNSLQTQIRFSAIAVGNPDALSISEGGRGKQLEG